MLALVFDTETTGLVNHAKPNSDKSQPNLVQLAAVMGEPESGKIYARMDFRIIPSLDGYEWDIPEKAENIHGISTHEANRTGVYLPTALECFLDLVEAADAIVAHNLPFDLKVIEVATERCRLYDPKSKNNPAFVDPWREKKNSFFDTLKFSKTSSFIGNTSSRGCNLGEMHKQLVGYEFEGAHDGFMDTEALWRCFRVINERLLEQARAAQQ